MKIALLCATAIAGAAFAGMGLAATPAKAPAKPASAAAKIERTSWGKPDLSGNWTNATLTPLERSNDYGTRQAMTPEEVRKIEGSEAAQREAGNAPTNPNFTIKDLPVDCGRGFTGTNCGYNSGWIDPGSTVMRVHGEPRTSFITSTPNGRAPAMKAEAQARVQAAQRARTRPGVSQNDNPEGRSLGERCLMSFGNSSGPVMQPQLYNNNYQFVQTPGELAIWVEMVHDVRHIRIGGEHRKDGVRTWMGDSVARWEGDTLVAETINFSPNQNFRGADENLKVTERFTRLSPTRVLYQFKVEDPTVWESAWGGEYEFSQQTGQVYEYACHEGNYALEGILAGARAEEAAAAQKTAAAK
jgi:hypothetical protein